MFVFGRDQCIASGVALHEQYVAAKPFPHIVIDDFIDADVLLGLLSEWPDSSLTHNDRPHERTGSEWRPVDLQSPKLRSFLAELNGEAMISFVQALTGVSNLIVDPSYIDGGLHEFMYGDQVTKHTDPNFDRSKTLQRRVKLIIDCNEDWHASYGGNLELWSREKSHRRASIVPTLGSTVIFNTDLENSYGVTDALTCPPDRGLRSLQVYYYTVPELKIDNSISTIVYGIMLDVFDLGLLKRDVVYKSDNINEWDALNQLRLISQVEKRFKIRFNTADTEHFNNIDDISRAVSLIYKANDGTSIDINAH